MANLLLVVCIIVEDPGMVGCTNSKMTPGVTHLTASWSWRRPARAPLALESTTGTLQVVCTATVWSFPAITIAVQN